jgi:hypothetical protein
VTDLVFERNVELFNGTHSAAIDGFGKFTSGQRFPDAVYFAIDGLTGYRQLWDRLDALRNAFDYIEHPPTLDDVLANLSDDDRQEFGEMMAQFGESADEVPESGF